ncbi:MAG: hypothetical protein Q7S22_07610 [Candidatus Micrarchaeota archaeon]|nr:hypothetical protein [Candidatus Micrarchaeota archaeon]
MNATSKKGFFFVFVIFLVISYMLASISITVKQIDLSEKRFAERFKNSNIELVMSQVNDKKINEVSNSITYAMLFKLNDHSVDSPLKSSPETAPEAEQLFYLRSAMHELVANGTASGDNFNDAQQPTFNPGAASFSNWVSGLNDTLQNIGFEVSEFSLNTFWINQSKIDSIDYNFTIHLKVSEKGGFTTITRDYNISNSLPIQSLTDSAFSREVKRNKPDILVKKPFYFFDGYSDPTDINPSSLVPGGSEGQGWFYGYLVEVKDALSVQPFEQKKYILVGKYSDIIAMDYPDLSYKSFGAYIITDKPILNPVSGCPGDFNQDNTFNPIIYDNRHCTVMSSSNYIDKPFMVGENFDITLAPQCDSDSSGNTRSCILFVAQKSPDEVKLDSIQKLHSVSMYDMEKLRDFAMCSYYIHSKGAPSYLQRMLANSYMRTSDLGIESFVLGNYIGATINDDGSARPSDITYSDDKSRLDNEFVNGITGSAYKIRGMPGCKDAETCKDGSDTLLGHFRLTSDSAKKYIGSSSLDIVCKPGNAGASCG